MSQGGQLSRPRIIWDKQQRFSPRAVVDGPVQRPLASTTLGAGAAAPQDNTNASFLMRPAYHRSTILRSLRTSRVLANDVVLHATQRLARDS